MRRLQWLFGLSMASAAAFGLLVACSSDDEAQPSTSPDAATSPDGTSDTGSPPPSDGGSGGDAADADAATAATVMFTVPAGGGAVDVQGATMKMNFAFPASAAGKTLSLTPGTAADVGFPAANFSEIIKLGPDGTRFDEPVIVKPEKPELVSALVSFGDGPTKTAGSPVPLTADKSGFELRHFSTVVVIAPGKLCDSEGSNDTASDAYCTTAPNGKTTKRVVTCKGYSYCLNVSLTCCVAPGADAGGCTWADAPLLGTQTPTDSNGGQYPYCDGDAGNWDGGPSGCLNPGALYTWNLPGCFVRRPECPIDGIQGQNYDLQCDGGTCTCIQAGDAGAPFAQGNACDNTAAMRAAFVSKCNFPIKQ